MSRHLATSIAGWNFTLARDYAEPFPGRGYVEVQPNGDFEVAYETDQSARDMNLPAHLITKIPREVVRALLTAYDAKQAPTPASAAPLARPDLVEQLTSAIEQLNASIARTSPDDRLTFAEIAYTLRSLVCVADKLAFEGSAS